MSKLLNGFRWKRADTLKVGDVLSWWGSSCPIRRVESGDQFVRITLFDPLMKRDRTFDYSPSNELIAKEAKP